MFTGVTLFSILSLPSSAVRNENLLWSMDKVELKSTLKMRGVTYILVHAHIRSEREKKHTHTV